MLENNSENSSKADKEVTENKNISSENQQIDNENSLSLKDKTTSEEDKIDTEKELVFENYSVLSLEELIVSLKNLIENNPVQKIKTPIEEIKQNFNQKFGALLAEKKENFLADGGESIDFQFSHPAKSEFNSLLSEYKKKREAHYAKIEKVLNENLEKRLVVIEELKTLIDEAEVSTMYKKFKEIQDKWKSIGGVPKSVYNDTWKTYQHHVERFYDLLHLSNDFREIDFKNNLEEKLLIIKKAEALIAVNDINVASKELQKLHKVWKEIGPIARELREEVWQQFSDVTKKIHEKRNDHFKEVHSKFDKMIHEKLLVVDEINALDYSKNKVHSDWQKSIDELESLRKKYFEIGKLPYSKSEEIWLKFKKATKKFNTAKNKFYKEEKSELQENLDKKMALIEIAESLKNSEDWDSASSTFKQIQADWKKIGHVPRKFSDKIWNQFRAACNHFFNRFHQQKNAINKEQQAIVDLKTEFFETLDSKNELTKETVFELMNKWHNLGRLPKSVRFLDAKFNKFINAALDKLSLEKNEIVFLKFKNLVDSYAENNDYKKLDSEQLFVRKKVDEISREIQQLENNLSFFSITNKNNPLVLNVKNQVADFKEELAVWKEKLDYIKKLDY